MKSSRLCPLVLSIAFTLIIAPGLHAQRVMRVNPNNITLRAVSLASLNTGMTVGDSGFVGVTHSALAPQGGEWESRKSGFTPSITLYAVAYAGDTVHAAIGGSNGALASTNDGGTTWHTITLETTATIRALTWNKPTDGSSAGVLLGVGDGGLVIRSTDQGQSWKTITSGTSYQLNAISFGNPSTATAVGNDTCIIQTYDGGLTWAPLKFPYNFHTMFSGQFDAYVKRIDFTAVAMTGLDSVWVAMEHPIQPLLIFQGDTLGQQFLWDSTGMYLWLPLRFTSILYAGMPHMEMASFTSSDWIAADTGRQGWYYLNAYLIGDADGITVAGAMRFCASAIWKQDTIVLIVTVGENLNCMDYVWSPHAQNHQYLFGNWQNLVLVGVDNTNFLDVNILPSGYGYAVGSAEAFLRTTDSGRTWTPLSLPITIAAIGTTDSALNSVYTLDTSSAIIVGWNGLIYEVTPIGGGFRASGVQERLHGIAFPSKDTGIIVGDYGTILRSTDRGATWLTISTTSPAYLFSVAFANSRIGVATGDGGVILRTTDEGTTWNDVNNVVSDQQVSIRQVQAFSNGTFLARAGTDLIRSTDFGQNWEFVTLPGGDTLGMGFYSPQIGIVAGRTTSSALMPDTVFLAYTTDAGTNWKQFTIPIWNFHHILFHWKNEHEVLLYGIYGFIADVDISGSDVKVTRVDGGNPTALAVYPNPSRGEVRVEYTTKTNGPVRIELWDEAGKKAETLLSADEGQGRNSQSFPLPNDIHGAFIVRLMCDGSSFTVPLIIK